MNMIGHDDKTSTFRPMRDQAFLKNYQDDVTSLAGIEKATALVR